MGKRGKKGEITTQQTIMIIILITSFLVVLFFLFRLNLGGESDAQICRNSVLTKGSAVSSDIPLNCYRSNVCITKDGSCEGMNPDKKVKVNSLNKTYKALADEMANCWWMFGEGKVAYVGEEAFFKDNYCSICSQILLDDSLKKIEVFKDGKIKKDGLYNYLASSSYSKDLTYAEYILGTNNIERLKKDIAMHEENPQQIGTFGNIYIGKQHFVVMGITSEVSIWKGATIGGAIGSVFLGIGAVPGFIVGAIVSGAGSQVSGLFEPEIGAIIVEGRGIENRFMAPTIQEVNSTKFDMLNCEDILSYT